MSNNRVLIEKASIFNTCIIKVHSNGQSWSFKLPSFKVELTIHEIINLLNRRTRSRWDRDLVHSDVQTVTGEKKEYCIPVFSDFRSWSFVCENNMTAKSSNSSKLRKARPLITVRTEVMGYMYNILIINALITSYAHCCMCIASECKNMYENYTKQYSTCIGLH